MTAYLIMEIDAVDDVEQFALYREAAEPLVAQWGGRFLARVAPALALEGEWKRVAVTEFPNWEAAKGMYESAEYQSIAKIRQSVSTSRLLLIGSPDEKPATVA
ncbi:DUF1330 domain-containing protein [Sphingobium sp. MK2]|uniref:DUF1330 domain-containing protein n=1 Tax=Sphingobium sp. MK2 TaxID=3116540 RepID=UPI0032E35D87